MSFIKHEQLLYILKFESKPWIKIGISKNLGNRIKQFRKDFGDNFDLVRSYVVTGRARTIELLERQLLDDLSGYVPSDIDEVKHINGYKEIRKSGVLKTIINQIEQKSNLNSDLHLYTGIDLSGVKSKIIPRALFPHQYEASVVLRDLQTIIKEMNRPEGFSDILVINELLYEYLKVQGLIEELPKYH